jgi:hypothetical protein
MQKGKESGRKGWLGPRKHVHGCKMQGKVDLLSKNMSIAIKWKGLMTPIESPWDVEKMASLKKTHVIECKIEKDG